MNLIPALIRFADGYFPFGCLTQMIRMPFARSLRPDLVFDPFYVDTTDEDPTAEHDRNASLVRGDPHRAFVQPFRVTVLHNVFDPRYDLESIDPTGGDSDDFSTLDFQIQEIAISSSEDIEIKMIANFKILAPGEINCSDRVNGVRRLIEFVFLCLGSFVAMNRPFLRGPVEFCHSVNNLQVFPLTEGELGRCERLRLDGGGDGIAHFPK